MKFCKITAGCVCAAVCFVGATQAAPRVNVTVKATVPNIFQIDNAFEVNGVPVVNGAHVVQLINQATGLPEAKTLIITPKYSGGAKIQIQSENGEGGDCKVLNDDGEHLTYTVLYDGRKIVNNGSSADVGFVKDNEYRLTFGLDDDQDLSAGTDYTDTLTIRFIAPDPVAG